MQTQEIILRGMLLICTGKVLGSNLVRFFFLFLVSLHGNARIVLQIRPRRILLIPF
jgi:hypothetical protein